jgi:hypothetical protein
VVDFWRVLTDRLGGRADIDLQAFGRCATEAPAIRPLPLSAAMP